MTKEQKPSIQKLWVYVDLAGLDSTRLRAYLREQAGTPTPRPIRVSISFSMPKDTQQSYAYALLAQALSAIAQAQQRSPVQLAQQFLPAPTDGAGIESREFE